MSTLERIRAGCPEALWREVATRDDTPCLEVEAASLHTVLTALRQQCGFDTNTFVTAIDKSPRTPRFEVSYQLLSVEHADRVRVRTAVPEEDPRLPSATDLWPGVAFSERECFDMFGVVFDGHPNLKRLLMPDGYGHHPLRKDFPHHGIEPDRLYREWERGRS